MCIILSHYVHRPTDVSLEHKGCTQIFFNMCTIHFLKCTIIDTVHSKCGHKTNHASQQIEVQIIIIVTSGLS